MSRIPKMGQEVVVLSLAEPVYVGNERKWVRRVLEKPRSGWFVGFTHKQEGTYHRGHSYDLGDSEPSRLETKGTVKLARIKLSENSNDAFAFLEDLSV